MRGRAIRIYTVGVAVLCGASLAYGLDGQNAAGVWQTQAAHWQASAKRTIVADRATRRRMNRLVHRYNSLVRSTNASQKALLSRVQTGGTVYKTIPASTMSTVPAPVSSPPTPTTRTS